MTWRLFLGVVSSVLGSGGGVGGCVCGCLDWGRVWGGERVVILISTMVPRFASPLSAVVSRGLVGSHSAVGTGGGRATAAEIFEDSARVAPIGQRGHCLRR